MRDTFVDELTRLAHGDPRIMFLTADLGYKLFDNFAARYPGRFLNMGISEANMVSVAAGLAMRGWRPVTYSMAPFATARCLEQIRIDVCEMCLPVLVVGVGAGYAYGVNGATHHGVDDVGTMRAMPGMTVLSPCDPAETRGALRAAMALEGPAYLRLGRSGEPNLTDPHEPFVLGQPSVLRKGKSVGILACGPVAKEALDAAVLLVKHRLDPMVLSVHTVKPIDGLAAFVRENNLKHLFVVEEHGPCGGLAEALAIELADAEDRPTLMRISAPDRFFREVGSRQFLYRAAGLDAESIARKILKRMETCR
jgi:transketolase